MSTPPPNPSSNDTAALAFSDEEILRDLPAYVLGDGAPPPPSIPQTDLNISGYHFLQPSIASVKCIRTVMPDGKIMWQYPEGLAHGLYYQQTLLKDYLQSAFDREKYPPHISYDVIPSELLHQVQLQHPPVLLLSDPNRLLRGYSEKQMMGVLVHFQNTTRALLDWIQLCRTRCSTTHRNTDWKWETTTGWDGYSSYENLILVRDDHQRRMSTIAMLEACIEAKHRPMIVQRAQEVKEKLKKRLEERRSHPGLYLDRDTVGRTRLAYYGPTPKLFFTLPDLPTNNASSTSISTSSISDTDGKSSLIIAAATAVAEVAAAAPKNRSSLRLSLAKRGGRIGPIRTPKRSVSAPPTPCRHPRDITSD